MSAQGLDIGGDDDRALGAEGGYLGGSLAAGGAGDDDHSVMDPAAHLCVGLVDSIGLALYVIRTNIRNRSFFRG
jgi:hypothetical protein